MKNIRGLYFFAGAQTGKMFKRAVVSPFCIIRKTAGRPRRFAMMFDFKAP